jgi:hypothetical protein
VCGRQFSAPYVPSPPPPAPATLMSSMPGMSRKEMGSFCKRSLGVAVCASYKYFSIKKINDSIKKNSLGPCVTGGWCDVWWGAKSNLFEVPLCRGHHHATCGCRAPRAVPIGIAPRVDRFRPQYVFPMASFAAAADTARASCLSAGPQPLSRSAMRACVSSARRVDSARPRPSSAR